MKDQRQQVALIILDGWGYREETEDNAIVAANKPNFDQIWKEYSHSLLEASGEFVGLPKGQIGNSEIGHTAIGAGRIVDTDIVRINKSIDDGTFGENPVFKELFEHVFKNNSKLHLIGLIGRGGVHAYQDHLLALLRLAKEKNINNVCLHLFTDGRDTSPTHSLEDIKEIKETISELGVGTICSISGRYYSMDRDNNWDRLEKFEKIFFDSDGPICNTTIEDEIRRQHKEVQTDELIEPFIVEDKPVEKGDGILFFNFRPDRARMLSKKILEKQEKMDLFFVTFTEYSEELSAKVAFPNEFVRQTLGEVISLAGLNQVHIAETVKFAHATYFLNGGREKPYLNEEDILIPSRKDVKTHDEAPEMKAKEIADEAIKQIEKGTDFIFINFANPDMVGHTANVPAIIKAIEVVDHELGRVLNTLHTQNGIAFVTADHGNAEYNFDKEKNEKHTAHTLNKVPAIITNISKDIEMKDGSLQDIAPTILSLFNIPKPKEMTGKNLLE
jgi:2,3-bisphosphoglycerate-independent phosphoglycerate mutase